MVDHHILLRIHVEYVPFSDDNEYLDIDTNIIPMRLICPIGECPNHILGVTLSKKQMYYHWQKHHLKIEGVSMKKFIMKSEGVDIIQCDSCKKGFASKKGLSRHKRRCKGPKCL